MDTRTDYLRNMIFALTTSLFLAVGGLAAVKDRAAAQSTPAPPLATEVNQQLTWLIDVLNSGAADLTADDLTDHIAPSLLNAPAPERVVATIQEWAAYAPFAVEGFTRTPTATQVNAFGTAAGTIPFVLPLSIESDAPHRITAMNVAPVPPPPGIEYGPVFDTNGNLLIEDAGRLEGLFDIGDGRRMYISCVGTEGPTVIFEAADGDLAASWYGVERGTVPFARVCSYDRPNTSGSASDPVPTPRSGSNVVADLHALLTVAQVPGPYVLVGHSDGGLYARLFAYTYPDEVAGLVLVDPAHEEQEEQVEALVGPERWAQLQELVAQSPTLEGMDFTKTSAEVRAARAANPLKPMPLAVIVAGLHADASAYSEGWPVEAHQQLVRDLKVELATLVPGGQLIIAEQSGHFVQQSQPDVIVSAIQQVVDAVRDPSTWATPVAA